MYHGIYTGIYHPSFNGIYNDIYHGINHGIYHDLTDSYHLTLLWLHWTACSHLLRPTACYSYCILSPGTPQRSGLCFNEHITGWTANRCCRILYATVTAYAAASAMRRPVLVRAVHKRRSIQHAKYGFFHVKHLHISQQCLVEQLHRDRWAKIQRQTCARYSKFIWWRPNDTRQCCCRAIGFCLVIRYWWCWCSRVGHIPI
jgi:hypothetical protein